MRGCFFCHQPIPPAERVSVGLALVSLSTIGALAPGEVSVLGGLKAQRAHRGCAYDSERQGALACAAVWRVVVLDEIGAAPL
jgi:hypothetical protein